jgi:Arc/MetJ-type ribon-helix-helix transcriptional regulator
MTKQKKEIMASQGEPAAKTHATIQISFEHERAIQEAIEGGVVRSADEIIKIALTMLPNPNDERENSRQEAVRRMEEFGKKYRLSTGEPITRTRLHEGHRY